MRTKNKVYKWIGLPDLLHNMWLLHHTAKKHDLHIRVLVLQAVKMSESSINLKVCILTYRTGIVDHHIGILAILSVISDLVHDPGHNLRLFLVHLASEGGQTISKRASKCVGFLCTKSLCQFDKRILACSFFGSHCICFL